MESKPVTFVHSLLFRCRECKQPLPLCVMSADRNSEKVDSNSFELMCKCGWSKCVLGMQAIRHWVVPWMDREEPESA